MRVSESVCSRGSSGETSTEQERAGSVYSTIEGQGQWRQQSWLHAAGWCIRLKSEMVIGEDQVV